MSVCDYCVVQWVYVYGVFLTCFYYSCANKTFVNI